MRVAEDGKTIDISDEEILRLEIQDYKIVRDEQGRVVEIISKKKEEERNGKRG